MGGGGEPLHRALPHAPRPERSRGGPLGLARSALRPAARRVQRASPGEDGPAPGHGCGTRPNPEPRDGHEGHRLNDPAARTGRTRHVRRSCDFSSLTSSAAHCRASGIFPISRNARAFARALLSADRSAADSLADRTPRVARLGSQLGFSGPRNVDRQHIDRNVYQCQAAWGGFLRIEARTLGRGSECRQENGASAIAPIHSAGRSPGPFAYPTASRSEVLCSVCGLLGRRFAGQARGWPGRKATV